MTSTSKHVQTFIYMKWKVVLHHVILQVGVVKADCQHVTLCPC